MRLLALLALLALLYMPASMGLAMQTMLLLLDHYRLYRHVRHYKLWYRYGEVTEARCTETALEFTAIIARHIDCDVDRVLLPDGRWEVEGGR